MGLWERVKQGIQIVVGGHSQGRTIVKGATINSGAMRPKQGEEWLHAYNAMPWLRANVGKIANGVAGLEWGITRTMDENGMTVKRADIQKGGPAYRRKALAALEEEEKAEAMFDHPFLTLWKNPCPALPGGAARKLAQVYYELVGEVFFIIDRGPRDAWIKSDFTGRPLPTALWPVPPIWVKRVPTPDRPTFEIRYGQLQMDEIPMSEMLWLKDPDPVNPYARGVGLFNALSDELDSDENAARMISYSFYNRNRPDILVNLPGASNAELEAVKNNWIANLQGVQNTLKSHFTNSPDINVEQIGYDFREMQVINLRQHTRDTIRQVPGTPPEMLGIQDQSNRSTIDAAEYIFGRHVIEPRAEVWREFLESQILVEFDPRAVLDYVSPVQEDKNFALSVLTGRPEPFRMNEIRKLAGLPALTDEEGGNLFNVNGSLQPTLAPAAAPGLPGAPPGATPDGGGGGLTAPGFEGGINVPGAPQMHLSVSPAAGSPESGAPAAPASAPGAPPAPTVAGTEDERFSLTGRPRMPMKGARGAGRRFRGAAEARLTPDQSILVAKWAEMNGHELDLDLVVKSAPIPLTENRAEEWVRRACAHLSEFPTSGWDKMFGPWSESDTKMLDLLLVEKGHEEQPRDPDGRFAGMGGVGVHSGAGSARRGHAQRVDGDATTAPKPKATTVAVRLGSLRERYRMMSEEQAARFHERVERYRAKKGIVRKGEGPGHPFRGNQYTDGSGGGEDTQNGNDRTQIGSDIESSFKAVAPIMAEPKTPAKGEAFDPSVEADADGDGVTDAARVGVPADQVPPPPTVPRLPNLTPKEREVEEAFASAYEKDPDGMADKFIAMVKSDPPVKFEADAAKNLFEAWAGKDLSPEDRAAFRSTMNTALHQTANAIAKRAFVRHLDSMSEEDRKKGLLVTVGGVGAGKGFALKTLAGQGFTEFNGKLYGAIWDSAGDQNATENPWLLEEAKSRGIPVTYAYVSADPEVSWADPKRGVVQRAMDPKDGRMVDAKVFADSYALGARNHDAFAKAHEGEARFVFVRNGAKIEKLNGVPADDLARNREDLHDFAVTMVAKRTDLAPRVRRGALTGQRIWPMGRRRKGASRG